MSSSRQSLFETCEASPDVTTDRDMLRCIANALNDEPGAREFARQALVVYSAALVFMMQAGFAMLCAGAVQKKNVQNTMLKNLLDACGASVAFFTVGYAFAFGGEDPTSSVKTFVGSSNFFLLDVEHLEDFVFQFAFAAASGTIVAGTLAERCQMAAYLCYSLMLTGWVYPIIAHAVWCPNGFLSATSVDPLWGVGMVDFAGSGVVHVTGGVTALFATMILGPRRGRFHDDQGRRLETPREFPGHSIALQMLGTFLLWFGWYGFNCGSALTNPSRAGHELVGLTAANTTLSGGSAGIVALFGNLWWLERYTGEPYFDLKYLMNGSLCGLVGITGACGVVEPWAAVVVGSVSGLLYMVGSRGLVYLRLDDAVDAIPVHFLNGMWGVISVGLFASPEKMQIFYGRNEFAGWVYDWSNAKLLGVQIVGLLFIISWVMAIMLPFFIWLDWQGWFRSDPLEEIVGLDTSYHGGLALMAGGTAVAGVNSSGVVPGASGNDVMVEKDVEPEYVSALRNQREERSNSKIRRRHDNGGGNGTNSNHGSEAFELAESPAAAFGNGGRFRDDEGGGGIEIDDPFADDDDDSDDSMDKHA